MPAPIEFYFDLISPYAYFGATQIETIAARHGRTVSWRPVLLGVTVMKIMGMKPLTEVPLKGPYLHADAPRVARLLGVPFRHHGLTGVNSLAASRAFLSIRDDDPLLAKRFAMRIFERLWVRGLDITPASAVAEEAEAVGVARGPLLEAIGGEASKAALKVAVELAVGRGVFGVPFFIVDDQPIWGSDRLWMLEHWLRHGHWDPAPAR